MVQPTSTAENKELQHLGREGGWQNSFTLRNQVWKNVKIMMMCYAMNKTIYNMIAPL